MIQCLKKNMVNEDEDLDGEIVEMVDALDEIKKEETKKII